MVYFKSLLLQAPLQGKLLCCIFIKNINQHSLKTHAQCEELDEIFSLG